MSRPDFDVLEQYVGAGNLDEYSFDFKIESLEQLLIIELDDTGVETQRVRGTDTTYLDSVEFDAESGGGTVTLADDLTTDYVLFLILANDEPTQAYEFKEKGSFTLKRFEYALDAVAGAVQRAIWLALRSIRFHDAYQGDFDPQLPLDLDDSINKCPMMNADGTGFADAADWPAATDIAAAAQNAIDAAASAVAAAASEVLAATYAPTPGGPFTIVYNAAAAALTGEVTDSAVYTQVDYVARIVRGTTVFARVEFSIFYRNGSWRLAMGESRVESSGHGITFTVHAVTGQISAQAGLGEDGVTNNAAIDIIKTLWAA